MDVNQDIKRNVDKVLWEGKMRIYQKTLNIACGVEEDVRWCVHYTVTVGGFYGIGSFTQRMDKHLSEDILYRKAIKSDGMCLKCKKLDFAYLQQHHPYPIEIPNFTITLCANHHSKLHFYTGGTRGVRNT